MINYIKIDQWKTIHIVVIFLSKEIIIVLCSNVSLFSKEYNKKTSLEQHVIVFWAPDFFYTKLGEKIIHVTCKGVHVMYSGPSLSGHSQQRLPFLIVATTFWHYNCKCIYYSLSPKATSLISSCDHIFLGNRVTLLEGDYCIKYPITLSLSMGRNQADVEIRWIITNWHCNYGNTAWSIYFK